jgi:ABC-type glutathione transport system ATPase component
MSLLEMRDVEVVYLRRDGVPVRAVAGASLNVDAGEIVGLVGETGCGKSSLARAAVGLVRPDTGAVTFEGQPLHALGRRSRPRSEARLQMVFQNPYGSLSAASVWPSFCGASALRLTWPNAIRTS